VTNTLLREIERWVAEAKVAANVAVGGFGWDVDSTAEYDGQDVRERWALDRLCEALLEKGVLVPTSKKKRIFSVDSFLPPEFSVLLWTPLLSHLQSHHADLPSVLADHIIARLLSNGVEARTGSTLHDLSFDMCLARWVMWIISAWGFEDSEKDLEKDVTATFVTALGPGMKNLTGDKKAAIALLQALSAGNNNLDAILALVPTAANNSPSREWCSKDMDVMGERLKSLLFHARDMHTPEAVHVLTSSEALAVDLAPGWRLLGQHDWKPCPVGVYHENRSS